MSLKLTKFTLFLRQLSRSINCQVMMICCVFVLIKMFIRLILFSFEDLCFNESKERISNTSGQTHTDNVFHHIVSQSNGNIFAHDDDLESCRRVRTISNDTNDKNHLKLQMPLVRLELKI